MAAAGRECRSASCGTARYWPPAWLERLDGACSGGSAAFRWLSSRQALCDVVMLARIRTGWPGCLEDPVPRRRVRHSSRRAGRAARRCRARRSEYAASRCPIQSARPARRRSPAASGRRALEVAVARDAIRSRELHPAASALHGRNQPVEVGTGQPVALEHVAHVVDDEVGLEFAKYRNQVAHDVPRRVELEVPAERLGACVAAPRDVSPDLGIGHCERRNRSRRKRPHAARVHVLEFGVVDPSSTIATPRARSSEVVQRVQHAAVVSAVVAGCTMAKRSMPSAAVMRSSSVGRAVGQRVVRLDPRSGSWRVGAEDVHMAVAGTVPAWRSAARSRSMHRASGSKSEVECSWWDGQERHVPCVPLAVRRRAAFRCRCRSS